MGKKFLVTGKPEKYKWKMTGKNKQVGSYLCQEATWQDSTTQIVAWFTPMIPVQAGPGDYTGLPGVILHMNINDGEREITATDVQLGEVGSSILVAPTEGKEVSQEEWSKIRKEKMKEMEEEYGGKGKGMRKISIFRG
jgi:GLPGLI family protein